MKELFTRYDRQLKFYNKPAEETKKEIEKLEKAIAALRKRQYSSCLRTMHQKRFYQKMSGTIIF